MAVWGLRDEAIPAAPCRGHLWTLHVALVGSPLPSPLHPQPHGADAGPNPTGTSQGDPTPPVVPRKIPCSQQGWEQGARGEEGRRALPAPRGTWLSLLPGNHHLRRRGGEAAGGASSTGCRGSPVKVQPGSPRKLPRHGPAPPPPGLPGARGERPLVPGQRRSRPRCHISAATLLSPAAAQALLSGEKHPPSPIRPQEPPRCHRRGVKTECGEGMGVKNPLRHVSCWHGPARCPRAVLRAGRALSPAVAPRG